jgi:predicted nucleotidyltransferase
MLNQTIIDQFLRSHPHPLMFVTVSGAHLYGFESPDSDYDLRGAHITPVKQLVRLSPPSQTYEVLDRDAPIEMDVVTHDVHKFFSLLLKNNGYVLEQVCSPLVVQAMPEFEELRAIAPKVITRNHRHHFLSFGKNQWETVVKGGKPTVKGLLYTYRVLLAGIYLMQTHQVESNLRKLNETFKLEHIDDLIARKTSGQEKDLLGGDDLAWHEREYHRLCALLDQARDVSTLPDEPTGRPALDDLLDRLRLKFIN